MQGRVARGGMGTGTHNVDYVVILIGIRRSIRHNPILCVEVLGPVPPRALKVNEHRDPMRTGIAVVTRAVCERRRGLWSDSVGNRRREARTKTLTEAVAEQNGTEGTVCGGNVAWWLSERCGELDWNDG